MKRYAAAVTDSIREYIKETFGERRTRPKALNLQTLTVSEPPIGWIGWYEFCFNNIPKANNIAIAIAEHASGYELNERDGDTKAVELLTEMREKSLFDVKLLYAIVNYQVYGRVYADVDFSRKNPQNWIKLPNPGTIENYRNNESDRAELRRLFNGKSEELGKIEEAIDAATSYDDIIGFVQKVDQERIYFAPDELIFIPRYPTANNPDGVSIYHPVWISGLAKLGYEQDQAAISSFRADTKIVWKVGDKDVPCPPGKAGKDMISFVRDRVEEVERGEDYVVPSWVDPDVISFEKIGDPIKDAQDHNEEQFVAGMGGFQAMVTGESANRATSETQERFFAERIRPIRMVFELMYMLPIFREYLTLHANYKFKIPVINFRGVTPWNDALQRRSLSDAVVKGWMTPNDARTQMELAPVNAGNVLYQSTQVTPMPIEVERPIDVRGAAKVEGDDLFSKFNFNTATLENRAAAKILEALNRMEERVTKEILEALF